jgi:hypothetical protein
MEKLKAFIVHRTNQVKQTSNQGQMQRMYAADAAYYGTAGRKKEGE